MGAYEGTGNLLRGGRGTTIGGLPVAHSSERKASEPNAPAYYYQRGLLMVPAESVDELRQALGRLGHGEKDIGIEPIGRTGIVEINLPDRRGTDALIEQLAGEIPVEPSYVLFPANHVRALAASRPAPASPAMIPRRPVLGNGRNVNIGVVDLGFFDPKEAGHPTWASKGVVLDQAMPTPDPDRTHLPFVGHGNAVIGILKQLAPAATVYTSTIESQRSDVPGGTTDRRLAEAIDRLLARERIHILVVPFGGSTRLGSMPVTERVLDSYFGSTLVFASAGNDGFDPSVYPAADPDVLGTGAWKPRAADLEWPRKTCRYVSPPLPGGSLRLADWSNRGTTVQLAAAGVAVPSPFANGKFEILPGALDKPAGPKTADFRGWALFTGTSFAVAVAAGCTAGEVGGDAPPTPDTLRAAVAR